MSVFQSAARLDDEGGLVVSFAGVIRIDNPYRHPSGYIEELSRALPQQKITSTTLDFVKTRFCNEAGVHVITDIIDGVYTLVPGSILAQRIADDEWMKENLPIVLNLAEEQNTARITFESVQAP